MTKRADLRMKTLFYTSSCTLLKTLRSGVPRVKMTKHADLGLKTLLCPNSCTLLRITNKWCAQCENDKTCWSRAKNAVLLFGQTPALCWKELISGAPSAKMTVPADLGLETLFSANSCTCWKNRKRVAPSAKMAVHADLGWKRCFWQTRAFCWKSLKSCGPSAKMTKAWSSPAENAVLYKFMHFAENR